MRSLLQKSRSARDGYRPAPLVGGRASERSCWSASPRNVRLFTEARWVGVRQTSRVQVGGNPWRKRTIRGRASWTFLRARFLVPLTPAITRGTGRARALRAAVRVPGWQDTSKARDRPDRRVQRVGRHAEKISVSAWEPGRRVTCPPHSDPHQFPASEHRARHR